MFKSSVYTSAQIQSGVSTAYRSNESFFFQEPYGADLMDARKKIIFEMQYLMAREYPFIFKGLSNLLCINLQLFDIQSYLIFMLKVL